MRAVLLAAVTIVLAAGPAMAQDTRAEIIRREQADKQRVIAPPERNRAERIIDRLEKWGWITTQPHGFYPVIESVYSGGGLAAGIGGRTPIGDNGAINWTAAYSMNGFWRGQTAVTLPSFASDRGRVTLTAGYLDAPAVKYYGIGQDSAKEDKTFFGYSPFETGGRVDFGVRRHLSVGGGVNYIDATTFEANTGPSIDSLFSAADSPALELDDFKYVNSTARAVVDWRRPPGYSGMGGMYRVEFDDFRELDHEQYSFRSLEAEVMQMIPLMRANWVIAVRGLATVTDIDTHDAVPYFLLPSIGGGKTLRGFPDSRFRDRHRLVVNAELRWTPARFLDMALFYDAGKVAAHKDDLDLRDLEDSYGIGMRVIGPKGYAFRLDVARSREHAARLLFSAGGAF